MAVDAPADLAALLAPRHVAVVGATGKAGSLFARPVEYLRDFGFAGEVYPVNPKHEEIGGFRCYRSLTAIGSDVDLVLVMVPAGHVEAVVAECCAIGARAAIVFSSGFAETGAEGAARQDCLVSVARAGGLRLVGPNCQGIIVPSHGLAATFTGSIAAGLPSPDGLAYVGQSGAVGGCVLDLAADQGVGLSAWISLGNQADVDLFEAALEVAEQPDVRVIAAYVESVERGEHFVRLAARCAELGKSLVLLRSGRTDTGRRAAVSHTGGLLPPDAAFDATARRHGAIVVHDVDELVDVSCALLRFGAGHGPAVAVVTASGGAGSLAADQLTLGGLSVPPLSPAAQARLAEVVPDFGAVANPVDVTFQLFAGGSSGFGDVCRMLAELDEIDQIVMVMGAIGGDAAAQVAEQVVQAVEHVDKPVHYAYLVGHLQTEDARAVLRAGKVAAHTSLARVTAVARALTTRPRFTVLPPAPPTDERFAAIAADRLSEVASAELLAAAGVPLAASTLVHDPAEAAAAVAAAGGVAVCKLQSPDVLHKSEGGLVRLGVSVDAAEAVAAELLAAAGDVRVEGVLVQQQIAPGVELLVGVTRERADLPPLLTVGLGGVLAEALADTVSEALPLTAEDVAGMLGRLRGHELLTGFRGAPHADVGAAARAIAAIGDAARSLGDRLVELEVNPLIVGAAGEGACAVDGLVRLTPIRP